MLWWIPITVAGLACLGVLTVVASTAAGRHEGRHVLTDPQEEWDAYVAEGRSYGSMSLDAERGWRAGEPVPLPRIPYWPAPAVDPAPWDKRLPTAAERTELLAGLSPETLDALPEIVLPDAGGWISGPCLDDPGPGDAAVEPPASSGPDQPSRWLAEQLEILRAWAERQQAYAEILA